MNAACWWLLAGVALALFLFLRLQTVSGKMYLGVVCCSALNWLVSELVLCWLEYGFARWVLEYT